LVAFYVAAFCVAFALRLRLQSADQTLRVRGEYLNCHEHDGRIQNDELKKAKKALPGVGIKDGKSVERMNLSVVNCLEKK